MTTINSSIMNSTQSSSWSEAGQSAVEKTKNAMVEAGWDEEFVNTLEKMGVLANTSIPDIKHWIETELGPSNYPQDQDAFKHVIAKLCGGDKATLYLADQKGKELINEITSKITSGLENHLEKTRSLQTEVISLDVNIKILKSKDRVISLAFPNSKPNPEIVDLENKLATVKQQLESLDRDFVNELAAPMKELDFYVKLDKGDFSELNKELFGNRHKPPLR